MNNKFIRLVFLIAFLLPLSVFAKVVYVNGSYIGSTENGTSWVTPFKTIEGAIAAAASDDQIWVAKGTYTPPVSMTQGFELKKSLSFYGGFNGNEASVFLRDYVNNKTIFSVTNVETGPNRSFCMLPEIKVAFDGVNFLNGVYAIANMYDFEGNLIVQKSQKYYLNLNNCYFSNQSTRAVILTYSSDIEITNCVLDNSGSILLDNSTFAGEENPVSNLKFVNITIQNYSSGSVQALILARPKVNLEVIESRFSGNDFSQSIGIVFQSLGGSFSMNRCTVSNNKGGFMVVSAPAKAQFDNTVFNDNSGALLISQDSELKILNSSFLRNSIHATNSASYKALFTISNSIEQLTTISGCKFDGNSSDIDGGRLLDFAGDASIGSLDLINTEVTNSNLTGDYNNGFIYFVGNKINVSECKFLSNNALGANYGASGITIMSAFDVKITQSLFEGNKGRALYSNPVCLIDRCTFIKNTSSSQGGAVYAMRADIVSSVFKENETTNSGGGVFLLGGGGLTNCKFIRNKAANYGGGYSTDGSSRTKYIINCLFDGNMAGSGAAFTAMTSTIQNCTIVKNQSSGAFSSTQGDIIFLWVDYGNNNIISNCIVWGNIYPNAVISTTEQTRFRLMNCNVQGGYQGEGSNNLNVDPKFADYEAGDYRLSCESPLINKGINQYAPASNDLDGKARIFAGVVDMGAYEFPQDPTLVSTPPQISFSIPATTCIADVITFENTTTPLENTRFEWSFGDGTTSSDAIPVHSYTKAGTYTIVLKATNACGASSQTSKTITIRSAYTPTISQVTTVCPGTTSEFTTDAVCTNLNWSVTGGTIVSGNNTKKISVLWGDGTTGNGKVVLAATGCGSGFCENPVSIEIPIVPVNFKLQGPVDVCQGAMVTYETQLKDKSPATIYKWSVKGGSILGQSSGYGLYQITVQWKGTQNDTLGKVYLTVYNEVVGCGKTDSLTINSRPKFFVQGSDKACAGQQTYYSSSPWLPAVQYLWSATGSGTTIDPNSGGSVTWTTVPGSYEVIAQAITPGKTCNLTDTVKVTVIKGPEVVAIDGETEVDPGKTYSYNLKVAAGTPLPGNWNVIGGDPEISFYTNLLAVTWGADEPFMMSVQAVDPNQGCMSSPFILNVKKAFSYAITGADTVCIGESSNYTVNEDLQSTATYSWTSTLGQSQPSGTNYSLSFNSVGQQLITLTITKNGKVYTLTKKVFVKATVTDIAVTGPTEIDPAGTGTYKYTVTNSKNIAYTAVVTGGTFTKNGNELTVVWGGTPPFKITATGEGLPCSGVPATLEVTKVPALSNQIISAGSACLNARVTYSFVTDKYTDKLNWTLSGGGTIVTNNGNSIIVEWNKTGPYSIGLQYERFGVRTASLAINVAALPVPQITKATICGTQPLALSTTASYAGYEWYVEPNTTYFSTAQHPAVTTEGLYRVNVTDANGCKAFATAYIDQIPLPLAKVFSDDVLSYCLGDEARNLQLKTYEGAGYQYQWYLNGQAIAGANALTFDRTLSLATASSAQYHVKITLKTCESTSAPVVLSVFDCNGTGNPCTEPATAFEVNNNCQPFAFQNNTAASGQFNWNFGDGTVSTQPTPANKTYDVAGIYTITLNRLCRSVSKNVEVPASSSFKLESPACIGQTATFKDYSVNIPDRKIESWTWNFGDGTPAVTGTGNNTRDITHIFNGAGPYTITLTVRAKNKAGDICAHTSEQTINLQNAPSVAFAIGTPPCTGSNYTFTNQSTKYSTEAKYLWEFGSGAQVSIESPVMTFAPGNQTSKLTVTNAYGCANSLSKSFTVTAPVTVEKLVVTGDKLLCNGKTATLAAPAGMMSYQWKRNGEAVSPAPASTASSIVVSVGGTYTATYQVSTSCSATTEAVDLTTFTVPNQVSGNPKVCLGDALVINTNLDPSVYSFAWKFNTTSLASNRSVLTLNDTKAGDAGSYIATVTDIKSGCYASLPAYNIAVYAKPTKPLISSDASQVCYAGSVTLSTDASATGNTLSWYKEQTAISGVGVTNVLNNVTGSGNYKVRVTGNTSGCYTESDKLNIAVAPQIIVKIKGDTICEGTATALNTALSSSDFSFQWYKDNTLTSFNGPLFNITQLSSSDVGEYYVTVTTKGSNYLNGCSATSNKTGVGMKAAPGKPVITGPASFCSGSSVTLTQNLSSDFKWSTGATTTSISISQGGVYSVVATNPASGCQSTTNFNVTQNQLPNVSFVPKGVYTRCGSEKISFSGLGSYPTYNWYVDGVKFGAANNNNLYPTKSGKYSLEVFTDKGCVAYSDTMIITALECPCYVTNTDNDGEGSLREALNCSNSKPGKDVIKFAIPGTGPFVIKPLAALPVITDSVFIDGFSQSGEGTFAVVLDGSVYSVNALKIDHNQANTKISGLTFTKFQNAVSLLTLVGNVVVEKNTFIDNAISAVELNNNTKGNTITGNIIQSSGNGIVLVADATRNTIQKNTISDSRIGVGIYSRSTLNHIYSNEILNSSEQGVYIYTNSKINTVKGNTIGLSSKDGIFIDGASKNIVDSNFVGVRSNGINIANMQNGLHIGANADSTIIKQNTIGYNNQNGILIEAKDQYISNNFVGANKNKDITANAKSGIYVAAGGIGTTVVSNNVANNADYGVYVETNTGVISNNISNNGKQGIYVKGNNNKLSKNTITNINQTISAIDLHYTSLPAGNAAKKPGAFSLYKRSANGIVLRGTGIANDTVEIFVNNNIKQQALIYAGSAKTDANGVWELNVKEGALFNPNTKNYFVNTLTTGLNTSELSDPYLTGCFNCICVVENKNDHGDGSLRAKVDSAHAGSCLVINFNINTPDTIVLQSAIRDLSVPVTINGKTGGATPQIFVKGTSAFNGFTAVGEGITINNLGLTDFRRGLLVKGHYNQFQRLDIVKTVQPVRVEGDNNRLVSSGLNTFLNGSSSYFADTALYISGNNNSIGALNAGNKIVNANKAGILVSAGKGNQLLYNSIYDNTLLSISLVNNGNNIHSKPTNLTGTLVGGVATVSGSAPAGDRVQVFASTSYIAEQAFGYATEVTANTSGVWTATIPASFIKTNENSYFVATATDGTGNTSQLSQPVRVGNFTEVCYVTNVLNAGKGTLREAVNCVNNAGTQGIGALVRFILPTATSNEIVLASPGLVVDNKYGVKINPYQIPVAVKAQTKAYDAFTWASQGFEIKNLTFDSFVTALNGTGNNAVIDSNQFVNNTDAVKINAAAGSTNTITNNYFSGGQTAISSLQGAAVINGNTIGVNKGGQSGTIAGYGIVVENAASLVVTNNTLRNITPATSGVAATYNGVPLYIRNAAGNISGNDIKGNDNAQPVVNLNNVNNFSFTNNKIGIGLTGLKLTSCNSGNVVSNQLTEVTAKGIDLVSSDNIIMSRNTIAGLTSGSKPIDLNLGTASKSNQEKKAPVIIKSTYHDDKLFLTGRTEIDDKVELFLSNAVKSDLASFLADITPDTSGLWVYEMAVPANDAKNYFFRATSRTSGRTSEASNTFNTDLKVCKVINKDDIGEGSFRDAIEKANNQFCNLIQFEIPGTSLAQIQPTSNLPVISTPLLIIDATSQPGYVTGSPKIQLESSASQTFGLTSKATDQFNVYGIRVVGYDTSLAVTRSISTEFKDNEFVGFTKAAISYVGKGHLLGNIVNNKITTSSSADYALMLADGDYTTIERNKIHGFGKFGIYSKANALRIGHNNISADNNTSAIGIKLDKTSFTQIYQDTITNAYQAIYLNEGERSSIFANVIGTRDNANNFVSNEAIYVDKTLLIKVYSNVVNGTLNGIVISNSDSVQVSNTKPKQVRNAVINLRDCKASQVYSNTMDSVNVGISALGSTNTIFRSNYISHITKCGIIVGKGSDNSVLIKNYIGASYAASQDYSEGEGIHISSSNNRIGGSPVKSDYNYIFHNKKGGIVIDTGVGNLITYNQFYENDTSAGKPSARAISLINKGNEEKVKPTITSHQWLSGKLHLTGTTTLGSLDSVHVYNGDGGYEEARVFMGSVLSAADGTWAIDLDTTGKVKPYTTIYLTATATNDQMNTSPLSDLYMAGDCFVTKLTDVADNDYPMANSLRMAVKCANGQQNPVGIYFRVDQYGEKMVPLRATMLPVKNTYGITFNGKNMITDQSVAVIDGIKLGAPKNADTLGWVLPAELKPLSVFENLTVRNFKNGIKVVADSIKVNGFNFRGNANSALIVEPTATKLIVSNASFNVNALDTTSAKMASTGVTIMPGAKLIAISNSSFDRLKTGVSINNSDSISVTGSTFGTSDQGITTALDVNNATVINAANNQFNSKIKTQQAVVWHNVKGGLKGNTFNCDSAYKPVEVKNSDGFDISDNKFNKKSDTYLIIEEARHGNVVNNTFTGPQNHSILVNKSEKISIVENNVYSAPADAFNLVASAKVLVSRNVVTNVRYPRTESDSVWCINIHRNDQTKVSNFGKQHPTDLLGSVKSPSKTERKGLFVQGKAEPNDKIEVFFSDSTVGTMNKYIVSTITDQNGLWEIRVPREEYKNDDSTWYHFVAVAIKPDSNTSRTSSVLHVPPLVNIVYVRNTYDNGSNSLRDAVLQVNSSDVKTKVIYQIDAAVFQPGPYKIRLDSALAPVEAYQGFIMDGNTQLGSGVGKDQRIIVDATLVDEGFGLEIVKETDSCKVKNISFLNAKKGLLLSNNKNNIEGLHFFTSGAARVQDTAIYIEGVESVLKRITVSNYHTGLLLTKTGEGNIITGSVIDSTVYGVVVSDGAKLNQFEKSKIRKSSKAAVLTEKAGGDNLFYKNVLGEENSPVVGNGFLISNTASQSIRNNRIAFVKPSANDETVSAAVTITGNSAFNFVYKNRIGLDSTATGGYSPDIRGISLVASAGGQPSRNSLINNEIVGTKKVAIYAKGSFGDVISENFIGTDSTKTVVYGLDSIGIHLEACNSSEASDNVIVNYDKSGIELWKSGNIKMHRNIIHSVKVKDMAINLNIATPLESNSAYARPEVTSGRLIDTQYVELKGKALASSIVEVFVAAADTSQSLAYVNETYSNASGDWTLNVPRAFFDYGKKNYFLAQTHNVTLSSQFSDSKKTNSLLCDLVELMEKGTVNVKILEEEYKPCPGPLFYLDGRLGGAEGLIYTWTANEWKDPKDGKIISFKDTSATGVKLSIKDDENCELIQNTKVTFKPRPNNPDFIVSNTVYANDTIVMVDVSMPAPTSYQWATSAGVTIIASGNNDDNFVGDDGVTYPKGRYVQFVLPDSGQFTVTQKSYRDGCFVQMDKTLNAGPKNPDDKKPYFVAGEVESFVVYPNPVGSSDDINALIKVASKDAVQLEILNATGVSLYQKELSGRTAYNVPLPDYLFMGDATFYVAKLTTNEQVIVFKILVH